MQTQAKSRHRDHTRRMSVTCRRSCGFCVINFLGSDDGRLLMNSHPAESSTYQLPADALSRVTWVSDALGA